MFCYSSCKCNSSEIGTLHIHIWIIYDYMHLDVSKLLEELENDDVGGYGEKEGTVEKQQKVLGKFGKLHS